MKRETWANLIFLGCFLAISLPGAVILFKKKMNPSAPPMFLPDAVRRRLPYMAPVSTPDEVTRFVPDLTGTWVENVSREHGGPETVLMRARKPVISGDHLVQMVGIKGRSLYLLAWDGGFGPDTKRYAVSTPPLPARVVMTKSVSLPEPVRQELMYGGYAKPPASVTWVEVEIDGVIDAQRSLTLRISYGEGADRVESSVNVFTNGDSAQD